MKLYYGRTEENTDGASERYLKINNCGGFEEIRKAEIKRPKGRADYQLIYVKSGTLVIHRKEKRIPLTQNALWLYRPQEPQEYSVDGEATTYFWIHFTGSAVSEMLSFFKESPVYVENFTQAERFCRSFYSDYKVSARFNELYYEGALISLFGALEERMKAEKEADMEKIRPALSHIEKCFPARPDNGELASVSCLSKYHFIKAFEKATGMTPQKYITRSIIDKSKMLLKTTSYSVSEIAALLGVEDALYFSRMFKKHTGVSPKAYRESALR